MKAATLADDYVLTHQRRFGDGGIRSAVHKDMGMHPNKHLTPTFRAELKGNTNDKICNFCNKRGHWKADCYALKAKSKQPAGQGKGTCVPLPVTVVSAVEDGRENAESEALSKRSEPFLPFVSESFVSLEGSE